MWMQANFIVGEDALGRLLSGVRTAQAARKWLASAVTRYGIKLDPCVFGYDAEGVTRHTPCHIGIGVRRSAVSLHAVGQANIDLLSPHLPLIQAALIQDARTFVRADVQSGECRLEFTRAPLQYFLRGVYVSRPDFKKDRLVGIWDSLGGDDSVRLAAPEFKKAVAEVIDRSLSRQIRMLMLRGELKPFDGMEQDQLTLDGGCEQSDGYLDSLRALLAVNGVQAEPRAMLGVEVEDIRACTWVAASSSKRGIARLQLRDVAFTAKARLQGLWLAGMALSFGDGVVGFEPRGQLSHKRDMLGLRTSVAGEEFVA